MGTGTSWLLRQTGTDGVAFAILVGGLVGALYLGSWLRFETQQADASEFQRRVLVRKAALDAALERAMDATVALGGLFESSRAVSESEFTLFAEATLQRQPEVRAFEWAPRVLDGARLEHIAAAQAAGHSTYTPRAILSDGTLATAPPGEIWPVRFIAPLATNTEALGLDLASEARRSAALRASIRAAAPVVSEPVALVQGDRPDGLIVFDPVYGWEDDGRRSVRGVVATIIDLRALLADIDLRLARDGLDVWLVHHAASGPGLVLRASGDASTPPADSAVLLSRTAIDLPGVRLELLAAPGPAFTVGRTQVDERWVTLAGVVISILLALGFKGRGDQTHALTALAKAVGEANRALEGQVAERLRIEADVRRLNDELQERVKRGTQEIKTKTTALSETQMRLEEEQAHAAMLAGQRLESLGLLAGGVAHDFNNLLTTILGQASLLGETARLPNAARESATQIELAAQRAAELVRQLLTYAGRAEPRVETMYISDVITEIRRLVDASLSKKAELVLDLDDDLPPVEVDGTQMRQVVMNLITNASDALGGEAGVIRVQSTLVSFDQSPAGPGWIGGPPRPGSYVSVRVTDDGAGMEAATVERMFEPFYTTKDAGHGLGLAAVLGVIRQSGGAIRVESRLGQGTAVQIFLPARDPEATESTASWIDELPDLNGVRVLLVDDEAPVRALVRAVLTRVGSSVAEASDGLEALELLRAAPEGFDIVILDMVMPRMDGPETLSALRLTHPNLPVVLSSGFSSAQLEDLPLGAHGSFLAKPYRARDLIAAVRDGLGALVRPNPS